MNAQVQERQHCLVCSSVLSFRWSDTHGVGVCSHCGMPYTIYHYEDDKRVDKAPEPALTESGIEVAKRYWNEKKRRVFPACYDMGILNGRECSYSGATLDDCRIWGEWCSREYPPPPSVESSAGERSNG